MSDLTRIRTYPDERDHKGIDWVNTIQFDIKNTFGYRAVGLICDGEVCQWLAYHPDYGDTAKWWPEYEDDGPVWFGHSIYAIANGFKYQDEVALFEWPDELDTDAPLRK